MSPAKAKVEIWRLRALVRQKDTGLRWALRCFETLREEGLIGGGPDSDAEVDRNIAPIKRALETK